MEGTRPEALVTIAEFETQPEFLLAWTRLESAGIECFSQERDLLQFGWRSHTGGIRLQVRKSEVEEALAIVHGNLPARANAAPSAELVTNGTRSGGFMRNFVLGVVFALLVLITAGLGLALLGFLPTQANSAPPEMERHLAMSALDNSVERHAPRLNNPVPPTDENLIEGLKIFTMNCALCHGGIDRQPSTLEKSLYPPPPNLILHPPDDPEWHVFYVIRTGVRYTGMPAWDKTLSEPQIWKLTAFLTRIAKLPPAVQDYWKKSSGVNPPSGEPEKHDHK